MNANYILKVGEAGKQRLKLIQQVYGAGTENLLSSIGIEPGMRIADIGCGIGTVSCWMAKKVGPTGVVWCVDNSREQLAVAKAEVVALGLTNVRCLESSADAINLPDESVDVAYCRFLLDHLATPSAAVDEMRRILKPGGTLVTETIDFSGMTSDPPQPVYARELELMKELSERRNVDAGSGLKVHRLFRSAGFTEIRVSLYQPAYLTGDEKRFWEYSVTEKADALIDHGLATAAEVEQRIGEMRRVNLDDTILVVLPRCVQVWALK